MVIGREREHALVRDALDATGAGARTTVVIVGEAGFGKSTLLESIRSAGVHDGVLIAAASAPESAWAQPFALWTALVADIMRQRPETGAGWAGDVHDARRFLVPSQVGSIEPRRDDDRSADEVRREIASALIDWLRELAQDQPLALVLDDLHWADAGSLAILGYVSTALSETPLALMIATRPPGPESDPLLADVLALVHRQSHAVHVDLGGFSRAEIRALAASRGIDASDAVVQLMRDETDGHPLFVTELLQAFAEQPGQATLDRASLYRGGLPRTIQDVIRLRVTQLSESARNLVSVAALFPRGVDFGLLVDLGDDSEDRLLDALDEALERGFLMTLDRAAERYAFSHPIIREALAETWSPSRRIRVHRRAAESIERRHSARLDPFVAELAHLYGESASLPHAGRGVTHALRAADLAEAGWDAPGAIRFLEIAASLAASEPIELQAKIASRLGITRADALDLEGAVASAELAIGLLARGESPVATVANICWRLALALKRNGAAPANWRHLMQTGLRASGDARDIHWARLALLEDPIEAIPNDLIYATRWLGYDPRARAVAVSSLDAEDAAQAIESFDARSPTATRDLLVRARTWKSERATLRGLTVVANDLQYRHGDLIGADAIWHEVLDLARRVSARPWQVNALNQLALLAIASGAFAAAEALDGEARTITGQLGPAKTGGELQVEREFALALYRDGDWPAIARFWRRYVTSPPPNLEAQLAVPLYASFAATSMAFADTSAHDIEALIDAGLDIVETPGLQQPNGVIGFIGEAVWARRLTRYAGRVDRIVATLIGGGTGDYPQTSLRLVRLRMAALLDGGRYEAFIEEATRLERTGQSPLAAIARFDAAAVSSASRADRLAALDAAERGFATLEMPSWLERVAARRAGILAEDERRMLPHGITDRELDIVRLVARGLPDRRIADQLFISERTVNAHLRNLLQKTDTANRTELTRWAVERDLVD